MLRPGIHVLRRSADELQVGVDPRRALILPDVPAVRAVLAALTSPAAVPDDHAYDDRTLTLLADAGLLVDADTLLPLIPTGPRPDDAGHHVGRAEVASLALGAGDRSGQLLRARAATRVELLASGGQEAAPVAACLARLLTGSGIGGVDRREHQEAATVPVPHDGTGIAGVVAGVVAEVVREVVAVVVAVGEPVREHVDDLVRTGTPHLFLRLLEGQAVVGPFVLPGETACLRCLDAHHTDVDAAWPLLLAQYASATRHEREDAVPEPVDPLLATLASAWAAREVVSFAEGRRPATTSTTVRLDPLLTALETQQWPRHPACGCGWA